MKLERVKINGFKNLQDFEVCFEEDSPLNVIIGNNGSGKSNFLEALSLIFKSFYEKKTNSELSFDYELEYKHYDDHIFVSSIKGKKEVKINSVKGAYKEIYKKLPNNIFAYYSGYEKRLKDIFNGSNFDKYKKEILTGSDVLLRKMFYLESNQYSLGFISSFVYETKASDVIKNNIGIRSILAINIHFKKPSWGKNRSDAFYGAMGSTRLFLDYILEKIAKEDVSFNSSGNIESISIKDISLLKNSEIRAKELFANLELLYAFDMISEFEVNLNKDGNEIEFSQLSEGEKQFILITSLVDITNESQTLFLLDEPDTFLHPKWQRELTSSINDLEFEGQLLMTTHSPLTLGEMDKENIKIFKDGDCYNPSSDSLNRDIAEIIEEIMEVTPRPEKITQIIQEFNLLIGSKDIEGAKNKLEELKPLLTNSDPFWLGADSMITRLELLG